MAEAKTCPNCGNIVSELLRIDTDMRHRLSSEGGVETSAEAVCAPCYSSFGTQIMRGSAQRSRRQAKEQHRLALWRSRVQLVRDARERFTVKDWSGAAIGYEKYIRVLEIIYETKPNELSPGHFNNSARQKELVVISSAYWDLMRIYDQSKKFEKRMYQCADQLAKFLPVTPGYEDIMGRIDVYAKTTAKNGPAFVELLKRAKKYRKRCFIATSAFESPDALEVVALADFRDSFLLKNRAGRRFVAFYYRWSPSIAGFLDKNPALKPLIRFPLRIFAFFLNRKLNLKS